MHSSVKKINNTNIFNVDQMRLFALLDQLGIAHETYEHPPIFTVEEGLALNLPAQIPGQHGKSLFLKNAAGEFWLIILCEETRANLKALSEELQTKRFSFANPEIMTAMLGVVPGSVTPFALMNEKEQKVRVVIDEKFRESSYCVFHPLENAYSTVVPFEGLVNFLNFLGYQPYFMNMA